MEKYKLYLQLFADDGDGTGADGDNGDNNQGNSNGPEGESLSFEDFLSQEGNQAEFDRRVQKAITTAVTNEKKKWEALTDDKLTEAEKLAKMTKEEKKDYEITKLKQQLADAKRKDTILSMTSTARNMLADDGIVIKDELLSNLISEDADKTKEAVTSFSAMFKEAIKEEVAKKLKGEPLKKGGDSTMTKEQILAIKDPIERQNKIAENLTLFQQ